MTWIPLHLHSQYSILHSTISLEGLIDRAHHLALPALGLTDFCNIFGAVEFYKKCMEKEIRPIIGCEMIVAPFSRHEKQRTSDHPVGYPLILLVQNREGYKNLCRIMSIGYGEGFYYTPRVDKETLERYSDGLICLSGPLQGRLAHAIIHQNRKAREEELEWLAHTYPGRFYLELQNHQMNEEQIRVDGMDQESWLYQSYLTQIQNEKKVISELCFLSQEKGIPCVATHDIRYLYPEDWKMHEIVMNIQSGEPCEIYESGGSGVQRMLNPKRRTLFSHAHDFQSPQQIAQRFKDHPEALSCSLQIAERCHFDFDFEAKFYPVFIPPHLAKQPIDEAVRLRENGNYLRDLCYEGIKKRYHSAHLEKVKEKYPDQEPLDVVSQRLEYELDLIISKEMCDYLLIVHDFISWAKANHIPVGPGRGSGAGSIVLYLIGITDIEPLRFHLFFERFINPERVSYPDIDVDICMEKRAKVIEYTMQRYGQDRVAQIITFGRMKAKMAIRDIGRVLNLPLGEVNAIAKLVPEDPSITLEKACQQDPELSCLLSHDENAKRVVQYAMKLEGLIRNTGIHAAGLIISGDPLTDHIPICRMKDSEMWVTQYAMKSVEAVGMLKIDFLGLKTLTSIQRTVDTIAQSRQEEIDWVNLPLDDQLTFDLLNQGNTLGVFQLESSGVQELAKQLHIDRFEEIIAVEALYRPGPMDMIPLFIRRKHGLEEVDIDHPLIGEILQETYGIMIYQEQVMQIASTLAKFSLGEGDILRRAMGKKDQEEMEKQRSKFLQGAFENGIVGEKAEMIFNKVAKFASYGFNKSHATAYSYLTYVTAFLKAHYPKEWFAALMSCDCDDLTKVAKYMRAAGEMQIAMLPPDLNESGREFVATSQGIRFSLTAIKGMGRAVIESVIWERERGGTFSSLYHFVRRMGPDKIGKKKVENLIEAGCLDFTGWKREALLLSLPPIFAQVSKAHREELRGVIDFSSLLGEEEDWSHPPPVEKERTKKEWLLQEKALLGFYLTGHPLDEYQELHQELRALSFREVREAVPGTIGHLLFVIDHLRVKLSGKTQKKFALLTISDGEDYFELPIWNPLYEKHHFLLVENQPLYGLIQVEDREEVRTLRCHALDSLEGICPEKISGWIHLFEQVQHQQKQTSRRKKGGRDSKEEIERGEGYLEITLKMDEMHLSHLLQLKEIFYQFPGEHTILLKFNGVCPEAQVVMEIGSSQRIQWNERVRSHLMRCPFIEEVQQQDQLDGVRQGSSI